MLLSDLILENLLIKIVLSLLIVHTIVYCDKSSNINIGGNGGSSNIKSGNSNEVFHFPEFDYKETSKNELTYREFESACEQSNRCENHMPGVIRTRCVRECISPSCYQDVYRFDELEEGEIDVRLISFKGCFIQRSGRSRNRR